MEIISQLKKTIAGLIGENQYDEAKILIKKAAYVDIEWDAELYYMAAIVAEYDGLYALSVAFVKQAIIMCPDNDTFKEYYNAITFGKNDWDKIPDVRSLRKDKKRVLLVEGVFDVLDLFTEEFLSVYEYLGYDCYVYNYEKDDSYMKMIDFIRNENIDFFLFFNNTGIAIDTPLNKPLVNILKCPKINIWVDHPVFTVEKVKDYLQKNDFIECVIDREHVKYLNSRKGIRTKNCFLPHGGKALNVDICPLGKRNIEVLYVGSTKRFPSPNDELIGKCLEEMIMNPNLTSLDAISKVIMDECSIDEDSLKFLPENTLDMLQQNEWAAVGYYRTETVRALIESGIKVEVHGSGWDKLDFANHPNLILGGPLTPTECIEKMNDSVIVLNSMPWFKDGTHERIFNGMLAGSLVVTDKSKWLEENLIDDENVILFDLMEIDKMVEKVKKIVANPEKYQAIADEGYRTAVARHTWSHRALEVLSML